MKKLLILTIFPIQVFSFNLYYKVDYSIKTAKDRTYQQIVKNKPNISKNYAESIARIINKYAKKYEVPADLIAAIAMKESGYKLNAVAGQDYGIMQVNQYNIDYFKLSKKRLLTDLDYSIKWGVHILNWFYETYGLKDGVRRYNGGTAPGVTTWKITETYFNDVIGYL